MDEFFTPEIAAKWSGFDSRDDMTDEQEREFVNDCYDAYERHGFRKFFSSPFDLYPEDRQYIGKEFDVVRRVTEEDGWDLCSLPAWMIRFKDGYINYAYPEEICCAEDY